MTHPSQKAIDALEAFSSRCAPGIMALRQKAGYRLVSPVHGLAVIVSDRGTISFEERNLTVDEFTGGAGTGANLRERMYRHAFLSPHSFGEAVNIEVTRRCSLNCPHCFCDQVAHEEAPDVEKIMSSLKNLNPLEISLTGGEIFLTDEYHEILKALEKAPLRKKTTLRLLANGTWYQEPAGREKTITTVRELCTMPFEFRFTLFDFRESCHDLLCGSAENQKALISTTELLSREDIPFTVNYTINSWNFHQRHEALDFLQKHFGDGFSLSTILYPKEGTERIIEKLLISPEDFKTLLREESFRSLASQYCDPSSRCRYHCNYPLITREGNLFHCNLSGALPLEREEFPNLIETEEMCLSCEAAHWCKKCPAAVPSFSSLYCPLARTAAASVRKETLSLEKKGYRSLKEFISTT